METLGIILIIYGLFVLLIALLKPPLIYQMKKFEVMKKIFGGERELQLFLIIWGFTALVIGYVIYS